MGDLRTTSPLFSGVDENLKGRTKSASPDDARSMLDERGELKAQDGVVSGLVDDGIRTLERPNSDLAQRRNAGVADRLQDQALICIELVLVFLRQRIVGMPVRGIEMIGREWCRKRQQDQGNERQRGEPRHGMLTHPRKTAR